MKFRITNSEINLSTMVNLHLISSLLDKKNLSIDQLAVEIGLKKGAIYKLMSENSTKIETLEKIAHVLNVPISYFFEETEVPSNKNQPATTLDAIGSFSFMPVRC